jgi:hypothetical protein
MGEPWRYTLFIPSYVSANLGAAVRKVCTVRSDLSMIRYQSLPKVTNSLKEQYYHVVYKLRLSLVDNVLQFEVIHQGQSRGMAIARYY